MNINSLRRIEEVILPSGIWSSLEISQDTIYLDFARVELGNPNIDNQLSLSVRLANESFIAFFYNNIWDVEFLSNFDNDKIRIDETFKFKVNNIKFLDFEYLDGVVNKYKTDKVITQSEEFDINNIRNDFFFVFEINNVAIVVGGNHLNFFNKDEKLDDYLLKELSNQWMIYFLDYQKKRKFLNKDPMCEFHLK